MSYLFDTVHFLPMTAVLSAAAYLPLAILLHVKKKPYPWIRHLCNYLLAGYFAALLYVTFFWAVTRSDLPLSDRLHPLPGDSFRFALQYDGGLWSSQIMWNVCLFMPLGALLPCVFDPLRRGAWKTVLFCFALSLGIEVAQYFVGRVADADDLICNTLGGVFGRALYTAAAWAFKKVKAFAPVLEDHAKTPGHIAALAAMALILLVPTALDVVNRLLPNGIFPVA
ncbi:MAG: VanZ family protein [Clostridia bacterium]|nr:VanZ family protein [Clostridia bacterium]